MKRSYKSSILAGLLLLACACKPTPSAPKPVTDYPCNLASKAAVLQSLLKPIGQLKDNGDITVIANPNSGDGICDYELVTGPGASQVLADVHLLMVQLGSPQEIDTTYQHAAPSASHLPAGDKLTLPSSFHIDGVLPTDTAGIAVTTKDQYMLTGPHGSTADFVVPDCGANGYAYISFLFSVDVTKGTIQSLINTVGQTIYPLDGNNANVASCK